MRIDIRHNFPDVIKKLDTLRDDIARQATSRALNTTIAQAKTSMSREIRQEFMITASKINQSLRINKANAYKGEVRMQASLESPAKRGRSLNVAAFGARQTKKGVSIKIKRNGPRHLIPGAFMINDGKTVMIRVGPKRLPIKAIQTIDVGQMFNTKRINTKVQRFMFDKFPSLFDREVKYYTEKFNRAG